MQDPVESDGSAGVEGAQNVDARSEDLVGAPEILFKRDILGPLLEDEEDLGDIIRREAVLSGWERGLSKLSRCKCVGASYLASRMGIGGVTTEKHLSPHPLA